MTDLIEQHDELDAALQAAVADSSEKRKDYAEAQIKFEVMQRNLTQVSEMMIQRAYDNLKPADYTLPGTGSPVSDEILLTIIRSRAFQSPDYKKAVEAFSEAQAELARADMEIMNAAEVLAVARDRSRMLTSRTNLQAAQ